jgi:hypothetical protein
LGEAQDEASKLDTCIGFAFKGELKTVEALQKLQDQLQAQRKAQRKSLELKTALTEDENKELELLKTRENERKSLEIKTERTEAENKELEMLKMQGIESIMVHFISGSKTPDETITYDSTWKTYGAFSLSGLHLHYISCVHATKYYILD